MTEYEIATTSFQQATIIFQQATTSFQHSTIILQYCQAGVGLLQCGLIAWGITAMQRSNASREVIMQALADIGMGIREQTAALRQDREESREDRKRNRANAPSAASLHSE